LAFLKPIARPLGQGGLLIATAPYYFPDNLKSGAWQFLGWLLSGSFIGKLDCWSCAFCPYKNQSPVNTTLFGLHE